MHVVDVLGGDRDARIRDEQNEKFESSECE